MYLTRNQADGNVSGVRIPPSPPEQPAGNPGGLFLYRYESVAFMALGFAHLDLDAARR